MELLVDFKVTVYCSTASAALLLAEKVNEAGLRDKLSLRKLIMGSELHSRIMDERIAGLLNLDPDEIYDIPGMTEMYGPGTGLDCRYHTGIHYSADYFIIEFLDPETLEPVPEGEPGEMVVTSLKKEGSPLVRYRTHDLCRAVPGRCPCGSVLPRHDKIMGRTDDMIIFKATNIYPGQIVTVLGKFDHVGSEYNILLDRKDGKDYMTIVVEREPEANPAADGEVAKAIVRQVKADVMVTPEVKIVDYGSLARSDRKSKRVFDNREDWM